METTGWADADGGSTRFGARCSLRAGLLAAGFLHPLQTGLLMDLGLEFDERGNVKTVNYQTTTNPQVFAAGDMRRGQSLVVWAISEGREAARAADCYLMGTTLLEAKAVSLFATA